MSDPEDKVQRKLWGVAILVLIAFPFLFAYYMVRDAARWIRKRAS